jgi:hypothetical protein
MAQMQQSLEIARPLVEVFAFVANPGDAWWAQPVGGHPSLARPAGGGGRFRYQARLAGRQFQLVREVTE